jgi:YidC/Oxa1 family membrane protein insertase
VGEFFHAAFVQPILNILVGFYKLFVTIGLPGAFGFSLIAITLSVRLLVHPFFKKQMETTKRMQDLKPHLDRLNTKHKNDAKALQAAQMKLYQEMGVNPAAGCLFALIQIPLFIGLYQTLQLFLQTGDASKIVKQVNSDLYFPFLKLQSIDPTFFGLNLALSPQSTGNLFFLIVPVITAFLQYLQTKLTLPEPAKSPEPVDKKGKKDEKAESSTGEEFQKAMNTQMKYFFPVMIGYFSYSLPLGLSLYWNIFSLFSIIQHRHLQKNEKVKELVIVEPKKEKKRK